MAGTSYRLHPRVQTTLVSLVLMTATALVYLRMAGHSFVSLDDTIQLTKNPRVLSGLNWDNFLWSFSPESWAAPLTWLTYAATFEVFGLDAAAFHVLMLCLHIACTVLLFIVLQNMTGAPVRSGFVAALFALHPINVESVAWVAELNNVLSGFFFMLTLLAWHAFTVRHGRVRYTLALVLFGLGLLAKPSIMTLPFILLLLDFWPLRRIKMGGSNDGGRPACTGLPAARLVLEKVPFMTLSLISFISNLRGASARMGLYTGEATSMGLRISNAFVSTVKYLGKLLWPSDLSVLYPFPAAIPFWLTAGAVVVLSVISVFAVMAIRRRTYFLVGWFWYLAALVPFLGIVQAGVWPEMADRYAYLSFIGVFICLVWGIGEIAGRNKMLSAGACGAGTLLTLVLAILSWNQVGHWKDSLTLYPHVISVIGDRQGAFHNIGLAIAHNNLGAALYEAGERKKAVVHYRKAISVNPTYEHPWFCLGLALYDAGDLDGAAGALREALRLNPGMENAHSLLGRVMAAMGNYVEAIKIFQEGLRHYPGHAALSFNLGRAYLGKGNVEGAVDAFREATRHGHGEAREALRNAMATRKGLEKRATDLQARIDAGEAETGILLELGSIKRRLGRYEEAAGAYRRLLEGAPANTKALFGLVVTYTDGLDYVRAMETLEAIGRVQPSNPEVDYNMACILSRQGRTDEAAARLRQALAKGFTSRDLALKDPDLYNLRISPAFNSLLNELGNVP